MGDLSLLCCLTQSRSASLNPNFILGTEEEDVIGAGCHCPHPHLPALLLLAVGTGLLGLQHWQGSHLSPRQIPSEHLSGICHKYHLASVDSCISHTSASQLYLHHIKPWLVIVRCSPLQSMGMFLRKGHCINIYEMVMSFLINKYSTSSVGHVCLCVRI